MFCLRPIEETTYGKAIYNKEITSKLTSYLNVYKDDLKKMSFEVKSPNKYQHIFITGRNEEEMRLPNFDIPYIISIDESFIVTDLRAFLKKIKGDLQKDYRITENFSNRPEGILRVLRSLIYSDFLSGESGAYLSLFNTAIKTMVFAIRHNIRNITTPKPEELLKIEMVTYLYGTLLSSNSQDIDAIKDVTIARLSNERMYNSQGSTMIRSTIMDCPLEVPTLEALNHAIIAYCLDSTSNIAKFKDEPRLLMEQINRLYMGFQSGGMTLIGFEHMPTWMSIVFAVATEVNFKKSNLFNLFRNYVKDLLMDSFTNGLTMTIQERFIRD